MPDPKHVFQIEVPEGAEKEAIDKIEKAFSEAKLHPQAKFHEYPVVVCDRTNNPDPETDVNYDPQTVYRGDNNLIVIGTKVKNPAGELVRGHHYTVGTPDKILSEILFQNGPVPANGVNGVTNEALLAIVIDRTEILNGLFPSAENEAAIASMKAALQAFEERTAARRARGVEGQLKA